MKDWQLEYAHSNLMWRTVANDSARRPINLTAE